MEKGETYNENEVNLPKINYMLNEFYYSEE